MLNILLVEDSIPQGNALINLIKKSFDNTQITLASNYESALNFAKAQTFNLFLLDIQFGSENKDEKNGIALAKQLRGFQEYIYTPIIFITALPNEIYQALNNIHCYGYIIKPYTEEEVISTINSLMISPNYQYLHFSLKDINGIYAKLSIEELIYIKIEHHNYYFYTATGTYCITNSSILPIKEDIFKHLIRCHKSYYINPLHIQNYDKTICSITMPNSTIPVGRNYKKSLEGVLKKNA